ncbi:MAG: hypothetical protein V1813_00490 [Candidatus Aenigmatarchaeota archaeon]
MDKELIGRWAFIIGLVISVAAGFVQLNSTFYMGLVVLGVVVGFLNVTGDEVQKFLLGTVALMLVGTGLGAVLDGVPMVSGVLSAFTAFVAGAALLVALKEVYSITKSK